MQKTRMEPRALKEICYACAAAMIHMKNSSGAFGVQLDSIEVLCKCNPEREY